MVNPIEVESSLDGVDYPIDKAELINHAKDNGASREVINALREIPDKRYNSVSEVSSELSNATEDVDDEEVEEDME